MEAYLRTVRDLIGWVAQRPGNDGQFQPAQLTKTAVELYPTHLEQEGVRVNHRTRGKSTISNFAHFLIEEKGLLQPNPTRGIDPPPIPLPAPPQLPENHRPAPPRLVGHQGGRRG